jgi:hypothetical protein
MNDLLEVIVDDLFHRLNGRRTRRKVIIRKTRNTRNTYRSVMVCNYRPTKKVVGKVRNMIFEIYTNDHNPPHFHVTADGSQAKYRIENPVRLGGSLPRHLETIVIRWARENEARLMHVWHESQPRIIEKTAN